MKVSNNNLAFQANFKTVNLGKNSVYWETIGKKFEEQTSKIQNAELRLYPNKIQYVNTNKHKAGCHVFLKDETLKKLLNNPEYKIINAFVKFFDIAHTIFTTLEEAEGFATSCENLNSKINDNSETNVFDEVYFPALDLVNRYAKSEAQKDDILKKWQILP